MLRDRGLLTPQEWEAKFSSLWNDVKNDVGNNLMESMARMNPINMMAVSGARGNKNHFTQLAGMRGLMARPTQSKSRKEYQPSIIEVPIYSCFREGMSVSEFFISTHGVRKGLTDTALKTAESGYLTRRLVDVAQEVIIGEEDCGTERGYLVKNIYEDKILRPDEKPVLIEGLFDRIVGRYTQKPILNPKTGEVIVEGDTLVDEDLAQKVVAAGVEEVYIRNVFTCESTNGICRKCYGRNMATGNLVEEGEAIGIMAAQAIGEPGTQLTMRTFHTGGVAGDDITQGLPRIQEIFEARNPKGVATISEVAGEVVSIEENAGSRTKEITIKGSTDTRSYTVPFTARLKVEEGQIIDRGAPLTEGSIDPKELLRVRDVLSVENYLLREVQKVYRMQGVEIGDKHVEVMVRQMLRKVRVMDPGSTEILPGTLLDIADFTERNRSAIMNGEVPATARPVLLGITKASLETNSFLSAASFQETTRVLTDASIRGKKDHLLGLKENVIIGKIIPAGTGMARYRNMETSTSEPVLSVEQTEVLVGEPTPSEEDTNE